MGAYWTAGQIIVQAAKELGIAASSDPYSSAAREDQRLVALLSSVGCDLAMQYQWPQLCAEFLLTTIAGVDSYTLPDDFLELIDQSGWNRTTRFPVGGPLSPQEWQYVKASLSGFTLTALFRGVADPVTGNNQIKLAPSPSTEMVLAFEYRSRNWTRLGDGAQEVPTLSTQLVHFEHLLAVRALKLAWKKDSGFDTASAQIDFDDTLMRVKGNLESAPRLSITDRSIRDRLIDGANLPITGFGGGT